MTNSTELTFLILYAVAFYIFIIHRSLQISHDHYTKVYGLRPGWLFHRLNICGRTKFVFLLWIFNLMFLICNRVYEGYPFSLFGRSWAYLDNYRGTFRWHICFNFVVLRMISFGYDYHWADYSSRFDKEKHIQRCNNCSLGRTCYQLLQERSLENDKFSFTIYLCYLIYAPLYIAGPIVSFNAFASQLDTPQKTHSLKEVVWYGLRWMFSLILMESMTHFCYYNAFAISGTWKHLSPLDIFIIGYGVLNFMWLKFFLLWRYFRFWSLINGIEAPENMPRCINNCYNLESFWRNWHASFNKWLVRYMYIPLGGTQMKLLNVWVIFTFVAVWHDLEWSKVLLASLCTVNLVLLLGLSLSLVSWWPILLALSLDHRGSIGCSLNSSKKKASLLLVACLLRFMLELSSCSISLMLSKIASTADDTKGSYLGKLNTSNKCQNPLQSFEEFIFTLNPSTAPQSSSWWNWLYEFFVSILLYSGCIKRIHHS